MLLPGEAMAVVVLRDFGTVKAGFDPDSEAIWPKAGRGSKTGNLSKRAQNSFRRACSGSSSGIWASED